MTAILAEIVREITIADLALLDLPKGSEPKPLQRLRDAHHNIARLLAAGTLTQREISAVTGYSESRISILKGDPAFQELMAHYKQQTDQIEVDAMIRSAAKIAALRDDAIEEMHERLLDKPEALDPKTLLEIIEVTADRSGFGKQTKSTNLNLNVDVADRIAAGRRRVAQLGAALAPPRAGELAGSTEPSGEVIEGEVLPLVE